MEKSCFKKPFSFLQFRKKGWKSNFLERNTIFFVNVARFACKHFWVYPKLVGTPGTSTTFFFSIFCYRSSSRKFHFIGPSIPVTTWIASAVKINFLLLFYKSLRSGTPEHTVVEKGNVTFEVKSKFQPKILQHFLNISDFSIPFFCQHIV